MREYRDFADFLGLSVADSRFLEIKDSPDAVFWYRAFLEFQAEQKERAEFEREQLKAMIWIGNMVAHSGTMSAQFFTNNKFKKNLGSLYMPDDWRKFAAKTDSEEARRRSDDAVADSLSFL